MINFYTYIHTILTEEEKDVLIIWPQAGSDKIADYTAKDLLDTITGYRQQLMHCKITPGIAVLLAMPVSISAINAVLATQSIGAIPVLPPAKPGFSMLLSVIRKQKIKAIITEEKPSIIIQAALMIAGVQCIQFHPIPVTKEDWKPVLVPPGQAALITHSSGSTGKPKAVYRSHAVLSAQHLVLKKVFPPWPKQRDFPLFPNILLHNLAAGVTSILPLIPGFALKQINPEIITNQIGAQGIETITGNVFYFKKILAHLHNTPQFFPSVKAIGIGGSPVPENLLSALKSYFVKADVYVIYGSSEAEPISVRKVNDYLENPMNGYAVGKPYEALQWRINAAFDIQTLEGIVTAGEIEVSGAHVAVEKKDGWLQTGDFGYVTKEGTLYLTARKGNEKPHQAIQHYQVEHFLQHQTGVQNAAALSVEDGFIVFIVGSAAKENIWEILNRHLPQGIIKEIYFRPEIPVDARHHSKILYGKLQ